MILMFVTVRGKHYFRETDLLTYIWVVALCVEWCKVRARMMRWKEECELVRAEMGCIREWTEHRSEWWEGLSCKEITTDGVRQRRPRLMHCNRLTFFDVSWGHSR